MTLSAEDLRARPLVAGTDVRVVCRRHRFAQGFVITADSILTGAEGARRHRTTTSATVDPVCLVALDWDDDIVDPGSAVPT